jgi:ABC-2 type transport system permease protein
MSSLINDFVLKENQLGSGNIMIIPEVRMFYNPELKSVFMFVPGIMAMILMLISAMMTSISIAREKEMGTMEVLLVSPLRPLQIIIGKVTPYVFLSFINAFTIIILGNTVFGIPINGSLILLFTESLLFILLALSLGIFISTISKSQQVAMFISLFALMLPTILLSGFIFPIESMPKILQWLSILMPPRWFIVILKSILLKGTGLAFIWKETLILLGMTIFFIIMSVKKFKIRLE